MLETYFESPKMLAHLRAGPSGPYMDGFAAWLERSGYAIPSLRYAICAQRRTSGTSPWNRVEHWPTWICWPSQAICEPAAVRGQKEGGATTIQFTAPGVTANILWPSASANAAARQRVRMPIRRSSSSTGDGCGSIAVLQNRPLDFILGTLPTY